MGDLVSILIPLYNAEKWVAASIQSALSQTWKNIELIVVDDGSKDNSLTIARRFAAGNVKVISQSNAGASVARNQALGIAQGDFIQYLDADDLLSPDKIESQIKVLEQNPPRMLAIAPTIYFYDGDEIEKGKREVGKEFHDADDPLAWLIELLGPEQGSMVPIHSWLTPREVADAAGAWDEHPSPNDDGEYFARVVLSSSGIRCVHRGACYYRKQRVSASWSGAGSERLQWGALRSLDLKSRHILARTNDPRAKRALARLYMDRAFQSYPNYPRVSEAALHRVGELGGTDYIPKFGTRRGQLLSSLLGWKLTKQLNSLLHQSRIFPS